MTIQYRRSIGRRRPGYGGGLALRPVSSSRAVTVTLTDVVITGNTALANGCGVYVAPYSTLTMDQSAVEDHYVREYSTAEGFATSVQSRVRNSTIQRNVEGNGGGVHDSRQRFDDYRRQRPHGQHGPRRRSDQLRDRTRCQLWVRRSEISNNDATGTTSGGQGGSVLRGSFAQFEESSIVDNDASGTRAPSMPRAAT